MYIKPIGTNPPLEEDRRPIWKATAGDALFLTTSAKRRDGTPVNYTNSRLVFELADTRFSTEPVWQGTWRNGIELVNLEHPGIVQIRVPDSISDILRRGSYIFSMQVADRGGDNEHTPLTGTLLIEYEATSPQHDIPYVD